MRLLKGLFLILSVLMTSTAGAEIYQYASIKVKCTIKGDRREIGSHIIKYDNNLMAHFGFQFFRPSDFSSRLTSFISGTSEQVNLMLNNPGIPNHFAQENWQVEQDKKSIFASAIIDNFRLEISLVKTTYGDFYLRSIPSKITLNDAQQLLQMLGDKTTPDFSSNVPTMTWLPGTSSVSLYSQLDWKDEIHLIPGMNGDGYNLPVAKLQIHYPPTVLNGLSYHLYFQCAQY